MAFELTITAPFHVSFRASSGHLSVIWGRHERDFVLEHQSFGRGGGWKRGGTPTVEP